MSKAADRSHERSFLDRDQSNLALTEIGIISLVAHLIVAGNALKGCGLGLIIVTAQGEKLIQGIGLVHLRIAARLAAIMLPSLQYLFPLAFSCRQLFVPQGLDTPPPRIMVPRGAGSMKPPAQQPILMEEPSRPPMKE